ncbi:MAG: hypothetical protein QNI84_13835 [Henriciella sp.]|nr:hypothetical protein [Henriciella sp.]
MKIALIFLVAFMVSSCANKITQIDITSDTVNYSNATSDARQAQLLLNIVKLRYNDPIQFLESDIIQLDRTQTTEFSLTPLAAIGGAASSDTLTGSGKRTRQFAPQFAYKRLSGEAYAAVLLEPMPVRSILLLSQSGWSIERLMVCCIARLFDYENARSVAGPTPTIIPDNHDFLNLADSLRELQLQNSFQILSDRKVEEVDRKKSFVDYITILINRSINSLEPEKRKEIDKLFNDAGDFRFPHGCSLPSDERPTNDSDESTTYPCTSAVTVVENAIRVETRSANSYPIVGRSLLGALSALSQAVHVPDDHNRIAYTPTIEIKNTLESTHRVVNDPQSDVTAESDSSNNESKQTCLPPSGWEKAISDHFFVVRSSENKPQEGKAAVSVFHRDHWFFVPDECPDAKAMLALMGHLYEMQWTKVESESSRILLID